MNRLLSHRWAKPLVFALCLLPLMWLLYLVAQDQLGANPQEALIRATGDWALRFLVIVLTVTPLRELSGLSVLARYRRMLGLFMYFYALLHFLSYSGFDMGFDVADIVIDIAKRPFILVGSLALLLLTPLAATSFNAAIRALGTKRWQRLHRLVYAVAGLAILHFFWMRAGKNDFAEVLVYAGILTLLLGWRLRRLRQRPR
jgi:sulfoxide reductase heme-binding subunit YedZ